MKGFERPLVSGFPGDTMMAPAFMYYFINWIEKFDVKDNFMEIGMSLNQLKLDTE